jgi:Domain of unknown function (DUF4136)
MSIRFYSFALVLFGSALQASLYAQKVNVDFNPAFDFSKVHTYHWKVHPAFEKHPEWRDDYAVAIQLILGDANEQLMKKGLQPVDFAPDVFITFLVSARDMQEIKTEVYDTWGGWYGWYAPPPWTVTTVENYKEGSLVIDMVNAKNSELVWRAFCWDSVRDMKERHKNVKSVVKKAFDRYPPKQK